MSTLRQGDEILSPNGTASLKDERARSSTESDFAQAIPALSDTAVNVASVPQRSPLRYPGWPDQLLIVESPTGKFAVRYASAHQT